MDIKKITVGENPFRPSSMARALEEGVIELGCNSDVVNDAFKNNCELIKKGFRKYKNIEHYYEEEIEALLTHETMHLLFSEVFDYSFWDGWDNVDSEHELSRYGLTL